MPRPASRRVSSSEPGSSGAMVMIRSPSSSAEIWSSVNWAGWRSSAGSCAPFRAGARNGPSRLNPSGSAPSPGATGIHSRTPAANWGSSASDSEGDVGRNDVTPWRRSARAIPESASAPPVASWPPQPWTWTSMNPGAYTGPDDATASAASGSTARMNPSSSVSRPGTTSSSSTSLPRRISVTIVPPGVGRRRSRRGFLLHVEQDLERVAVRGVAALGRLDSAAHVVHDHPRLHEQGVALAKAQQACVLVRRGCCRDRRRTAAEVVPAVGERVVQRAGLQVRAHHGACGPADEHGRLNRDRLVVGAPEPSQLHHGLSLDEPERTRLRLAGRPDLAVENPRRRVSAAALHLPAEGEQSVRASVGGRLCDERPPAGDPHHEALVREPLHRVACRHPADTELPAQVGIGREGFTGRERHDAFPQGLLDPPPVRDVPGERHRPAPDAPVPAPASELASARSAPWTAAPIAPAHVPS